MDSSQGQKVVQSSSDEEYDSGPSGFFHRPLKKLRDHKTGKKTPLPFPGDSKSSRQAGSGQKVKMKKGDGGSKKQEVVQEIVEVFDEDKEDTQLRIQMKARFEVDPLIIGEFKQLYKTEIESKIDKNTDQSRKDYIERFEKQFETQEQFFAADDDSSYESLECMSVEGSILFQKKPMSMQKKSDSSQQQRSVLSSKIFKHGQEETQQQQQKFSGTGRASATRRSKTSAMSPPGSQAKLPQLSDAVIEEEDDYNPTQSEEIESPKTEHDLESVDNTSLQGLKSEKRSGFFSSHNVTNSKLDSFTGAPKMMQQSSANQRGSRFGKQMASVPGHQSSFSSQFKAQKQQMLNIRSSEMAISNSSSKSKLPQDTSGVDEQSLRAGNITSMRSGNSKAIFPVRGVQSDYLQSALSKNMVRAASKLFAAGGGISKMKTQYASGGGGTSEADIDYFAQLMTQFKENIDKKVKKLAVQFDRKVRDLKPELYETACEFLLAQTKLITKLFTNTHHQLVQQFMDYKERTNFVLREKDWRVSQLKLLETALAQKSPVLEAENAIDESSVLVLYDCLVPRIREHRRFKITKDSAFSIADFKAQLQVKQLEYNLQKKELPIVQKENQKLRVQVHHLESEMNIVKWYMETMESGIDTRQVVQEYALLQKKHREYREASIATIKQLENENKRLQNQLKNALDTVKKQQQSVVIPLIDECSKREAECQKLRTEFSDRTRSLKIMFSMIRSPLLCDMVYKSERKRMTAAEIKRLDQQSVFTLRQYEFDKSKAECFVKETFKKVLDQISQDVWLKSPSLSPERKIPRSRSH